MKEALQLIVNLKSYVTFAVKIYYIFQELKPAFTTVFIRAGS